MPARHLPNIWDDRSRLERADAYCRDIQPHLTARLADYLNEAHGTRLGTRYWQTLTGAWLIYYTHQLFDRYSQIVSAFDAHPAAVSICLSEADYQTPRDVRDFLHLYHTDAFNLQLYSSVFRFLGKAFPESRLSADPRKTGSPGHEPPTWRQRLREGLSSGLEQGFRGALRLKGADIVCDGLYPLKTAQLCRLAASLRGKLVPLLSTMPERLRVPARRDARRLGLATLRGRDEFERLLFSTLPWALPAVLLEGFPAARAHCTGRTRRPPRAVFCSTGIFHNDLFKFAAAEWAEQGARLWGFQHGGQYGTARYSLAEASERALYDRYFTWGWAATSGDAKLADLPIPYLSELAKKRRPKAGKRDDILVLSLENVKNSHHLFPHPLGWQWEEFLVWLERFLAALGPLRERVNLRLYPYDYGWCQKQRLAKRFPDIRFDPRGVPFEKSLRNARLVVTSYPGTPFHELLALDAPSVHFWKDAVWEMRPEAEPAFSALRDARIVHGDPESAGRHIQDVYAAPGRWWEAPSTQEARRRFVDLYARVDRRWLADWRESLQRELRSIS